jgi:hypothetical protein
MKFKRAEFNLRGPEAVPVKIVADAAISSVGVHGGRLIPLLLLDTSTRPDVSEYLRVHEAFGSGDVTAQWCQLEGHEGTVSLFLRFIRPMELAMILEFNIVRQGILVEQALIGQGLYLASATGPEDRLMNNLDRPKVIVEIGSPGFRDAWDQIFYKEVVRDFRKKGLGRSDARRAARSVIDEFRRIGSLRIRDSVLPRKEG